MNIPAQIEKSKVAHGKKGLWLAYFLFGFLPFTLGQNLKNLVDPNATFPLVAEMRPALPEQNNTQNFKLRSDFDRIARFNNKNVRDAELIFTPDTVIIYSVNETSKRYNYFYSSSGKRLMTFIREYMNGNWVNVAYESCIYNAEDDLQSSVWQQWQNGQWVFWMKYLYSYTNTHKIESYTVQNWTSAGWTNVEKTSNVYNIFDSRISYKKELWANNEWNNYIFELYTYNEQNILIDGTRQIWNAVYWLNDQYYSYIYGNNANLLSATIKNWVNDEWVNFYKENYTYANNMLSDYIGMEWENNSWENKEKYTYNYATNGLLTQTTGQYWAAGQWVNAERNQFSHNSYGGIQSALFQSWSGANWQDARMLDYAYDSYGNTTKLDHFDWNSTGWNFSDAVLELFYSFSYSKIYFTGYRALASYGSMMVGLDPNKAVESAFQIYPNPAKHSLHIETKLQADEEIRIDLYAMDGRLLNILFKGKAAGLPPLIDIENLNLPPGLYLSQLKTQTQILSKKIIIQ